VLCDNFVSRWDNDDVEKLSPWDLEPLEDCSMSTSRVCFLQFLDISALQTRDRYE